MSPAHRPLAVHLLLLSLLHFLVDGVCACGLVIISSHTESYAEICAIIVLYDVLAFGTQPLTGRWVDSSGTRPGGLGRAATLLAAGALASSLPVSGTLWVAAVGATLLGMGNSLFHVYGGKYVAAASGNDIRAMGIFVSTGAVGLATGLGFGNVVLLAIYLFLLLLLSALHLRYRHYIAPPSNPLQAGMSSATTKAASPIPFLYLACLMLVVSGRSFMGENVPPLHSVLSLLGKPTTMVVVSIVVMAGKAAGGFLSRWWGVREVFCASLLLSGTVMLVCPWHDVFVVVALFLINLSMPCTLYFATKATPGREGWAFGLLAMALLPGYLLGYLTKGDATCQSLLVPLMATIVLESLVLLCMRERRWQVLAASVLLNILTNVPLNVFIMTCGGTSLLGITGMECIVVAVECIGYWLVLRNWRQAFTYSFLCNAFSATTGFLFQAVFFYIF